MGLAYFLFLAVVVAAVAIVQLGWTDPRQTVNLEHLRPSGPEYFTSEVNGLRIFTRRWTVDQPRAAILLVHGFGEHSGRYEYLAKKLNAEQYSVYTFDHQGHGLSEGVPGYVERFGYYADDTLQYAAAIKGEIKDLPLFLVGHSMGGAVSSLSLLKDSSFFRGAVLSAAAIIPMEDVAKPHLVFLANLLSDWVPKLPVEGLVVENISRDEEIVKANKKDPLNYRGGMRVRWGAEILKAMSYIQENANKITLPIMLLSGTNDKLVNMEGTRFLHESVLSADKTIILYEGLYHEIFNEPEKDKVISDLVSWLDIHI